jgi:hypothetical protein
MAAAVMQFQLRDYAIVDGGLDDFVAECREHLLPLRLSMGFSVLGPWIDRDASRFVWLLGFDGDGRAADDAYRAAREKQALDPDPARLIAGSRVVWLEPA